MKLNQAPSGEIQVLDSGFTDQVVLDTVNEDVLRIKAVICNSLNDLNRLYFVDRALYANTPQMPMYYEFTPGKIRLMRTPVVISDVKLYCVEKVWGVHTLRITR
ncbi:MAG TPA: hypothetical protein VFE98_08730 [Candidatus Bathyarchaeia archaeon]|nr:hypothetical protein [Candidatus Bathyarchaeia archaeon]